MRVFWKGAEVRDKLLAPSMGESRSIGKLGYLTNHVRTFDWFTAYPNKWRGAICRLVLVTLTSCSCSLSSCAPTPSPPYDPLVRAEVEAELKKIPQNADVFFSSLRSKQSSHPEFYVKWKDLSLDDPAIVKKYWDSHSKQNDFVVVPGVEADRIVRVIPFKSWTAASSGPHTQHNTEAEWYLFVDDQDRVVAYRLLRVLR